MGSIKGISAALLALSWVTVAWAAKPVRQPALGPVLVVDSVGKTVGRAVFVPRSNLPGVAISVSELTLVFPLEQASGQSTHLNWSVTFNVYFTGPNCTGSAYLLDAFPTGSERATVAVNAGNQWFGYYASRDIVPNVSIQSSLDTSGRCYSVGFVQNGWPVEQSLSLDELGIAPFYYK